jgi:hypothetical protein
MTSKQKVLEYFPRAWAQRLPDNFGWMIWADHRSGRLLGIASAAWHAWAKAWWSVLQFIDTCGIQKGNAEKQLREYSRHGPCHDENRGDSK